MANNLQNVLSFTKSGVVIPDTSVIRDAIINDLEESVFHQTIDKSQETILGRLIEYLTITFSQMTGLSAWLSTQFNIKQSTGLFLDAWASNFNMNRKTSANSKVFCSMTGDAGTVIPAGSIIANTDGDYFLCDTEVTLDSAGDGSGYFTAQESGPIPCGSGTVNQIVTAIPGWNTVTNSANGVLGSDVESDYSLRNRILESYFVGAGYTGTVIKALNEIDGVTAVLVLSNPNSSNKIENGVTMLPHSIYVCIVGGDNQKIAETIYKTKPIGAAYTTVTGDQSVNITDEYSGQTITIHFMRPTSNTISATLTVRNDSYAGDDLAGDVQTAVTEFFNSAGIGKTVQSFSLAVSVQNQVSGVTVTSCTFNSGSSSVTCTNKQVFALNAVNVTVQ